MRKAVDFDGTLAEYHGFKGADVLGDPIPVMVERVLGWMENDDDVVICTARAHPSNGDEAQVAIDAIREWCVTHLGRELEVTCMKDPLMEEIYDDRAVTVEENTGRILTEGFEEKLDDEPDSIGEFLS